MNQVRLILFGLSLMTATTVMAQQTDQVNWMSFEEMESAFAKQPKWVFIDFWADWCVPCKRMEQYVFTNPEVIRKLNQDFYPVKMDAETADTVYFGGREFINSSKGPQKAGFHELAILLGRDEDGLFSLPTMVIFDKKFQVIQKYHQYLHSKDMLKALTALEENPK